MRNRRVFLAVAVVAFLSGCENGDDYDGGDYYTPTAPTPVRETRTPADDCVSLLDSYLESVNDGEFFDFDVRFRNGCAHEVVVYMRGALYNPNGVRVDRTGANGAHRRYEPGSTLWQCRGYASSGACRLFDQPAMSGTYSIQYNWNACYSDRINMAECDVEYPD